MVWIDGLRRLRSCSGSARSIIVNFLSGFLLSGISKHLELTDASSAVALRKLLHHINSLSTEGPSESHRSELCADCSRQATRERIREGPMPGLPLSDSSSGIGRGPPMFAIEWSGKMKSGKKFAEAKRGKEGISCLYGPVLRAGVALPSPTPHSIPHKHKLALQKFGW